LVVGQATLELRRWKTESSDNEYIYRGKMGRSLHEL